MWLFQSCCGNVAPSKETLRFIEASKRRLLSVLKSGKRCCLSYGNETPAQRREYVSLLKNGQINFSKEVWVFFSKVGNERKVSKHIKSWLESIWGYNGAEGAFLSSHCSSILFPLARSSSVRDQCLLLLLPTSPTKTIILPLCFPQQFAFRK